MFKCCFVSFLRARHNLAVRFQVVPQHSMLSVLCFRQSVLVIVLLLNYYYYFCNWMTIKPEHRSLFSKENKMTLLTGPRKLSNVIEYITTKLMLQESQCCIRIKCVAQWPLTNLQGFNLYGE